jgi:hypothetical protein
MTDVRHYTNGHGGTSPSGRAAQTAETGDFVNSLQTAVRENPISAALIGMGVLWLFMGGSNTSLLGGGGRKSIFGGAAEGAVQAAGALRDTGRQVGNVAGIVAKTAANLVQQGSEAIGDGASKVAGQAANVLATAYDATTDMASGAAGQFSSVVHDLHDTGSQWGTAAQKNIAEMFERQPLLLGAIGVAIGAGIAASIPTTEAEKNLMGGASEALRETVTNKIDEVKTMADVAAQEAKVQGLTPEAVRGVAAKVQEVVSGGEKQRDNQGRKV